jgi:hypothetical protein
MCKVVIYLWFIVVGFFERCSFVRANCGPLSSTCVVHVSSTMIYTLNKVVKWSLYVCLLTCYCAFHGYLLSLKGTTMLSVLVKRFTFCAIVYCVGIM